MAAHKAYDHKTQKYYTEDVFQAFKGQVGTYVVKFVVPVQPCGVALTAKTEEIWAQCYQLTRIRWEIAAFVGPFL